MMMTNQNIGKLKVSIPFDYSQRMLRSIHWLCQYMDRCRIPVARSITFIFYKR